MARQTKEEKITYRIRNLHFKVFLYGFAGIYYIIQPFLVAIYSKEASSRDLWVGESFLL